MAAAAAAMEDGPSQQKGAPELPMIVFDCSKGETFTPVEGLKTLHRKLKAQYRVKMYARVSLIYEMDGYNMPT